MFPLAKAWALSIHNIQGTTKKQAVIDLGSNIFDAGMSYVALSRITELSGLALTALDPSKIYACPSVLKENNRPRNMANARAKKDEK